ncbi:sodium:proton antiporter NhaD [candidate division KSB1 bacterium]
MVVVFILGYTAIALEHPIKVDKAASALLLGMSMWVLYIIGRVEILSMVNDAGEFVSAAWRHYVHSGGHDVNNPEIMREFIVEHEVLHHLAEISTILFFLLGAMTIVEAVDQHQGFKLITDRIKTTNKVKLLWITSILTFFMSAALDNLTTTIVMVALLRKLIADKESRWFFASMVVLAANAGGAWSPIGDVTTIMLWIGGQVTTVNIILKVFVPSLITMVIPLIILSFIMKGTVERPKLDENNNKEFTTSGERKLLLIMGVCGLLFVPVFKTLTHLPPYMGMLISLSIIWITTEILHRNKPIEDRRKLTILGVLRKVDVPTVFFFLGILTAVSSLQSAGQLGILADYLNKNVGDIYIINIIIGILSSIVDNVPLVAGAMGMYEIAPLGATGYDAFFVVDGIFWEFLAYCAGTGGSILIIGSAAGVAAMGMEKIDFIWYMKKISLLALVGYFAGAAAYYFQVQLTH